MAKVSPVSIKYMIYASFSSAGPLEKPDVIGAIFGQTEGLLGEDLEMRELQKEGRIGRIEVDLEIVDGRSVGEIQVPTAMDKSETTLIAAALETIDRIGPTEAKIEVVKIEDVRGGKRDYILERAKKLMQNMDGGSFREMSEGLKGEARIDKIQEYGTSKLPAGDLSGNELIVVEGRADVVNLLRNRVNNVIGMDGTKLPREIAELGREKEITLFVDGDRGGKLIANNVIANADIKWVAVAPEGKEVEELTGKEILMSLRKKIPAQRYVSGEGFSQIAENKENEATESDIQIIKYEGDVKKRLREIYESRLRGSKGALLLNPELDVIKRIGVREVAKNVKGSRQKIGAVIMEGTATDSIVRICEEEGIAYLAASNFSEHSGNSKVVLVSI